MNTQKNIEQAMRKAFQELNISFPEQDSLLNMCSSLMAIASGNNNLEDEAKFIENTSFDLLSKKHFLTLLEQQVAELNTLKKLSLHLSSSLNLKTVLNAVVTDARDLLKNTRTVHIFLYDTQNDKLTFGSALDQHGLKEESFAIPRPNGLTYQVAHKGEMVIVQNMETDPIYQDVPKKWTGSIVGIPLKTDQEVVGVMNISRSSTGDFSLSELKLLIMLAEHAALAISNAWLHDQVSRQAKRDTLTGLPNRRALDERLDEEVLAAHRTGHPFVVVMMDLDGFKDVNDNYGHPVGDQVLRVLFNYLAKGLRTSDFLARYGGDELTLVGSALIQVMQ